MNSIEFVELIRLISNRNCLLMSVEWSHKTKKEIHLLNYLSFEWIVHINHLNIVNELINIDDSLVDHIQKNY